MTSTDATEQDSTSHRYRKRYVTATDRDDRSPLHRMEKDVFSSPISTTPRRGHYFAAGLWQRGRDNRNVATNSCRECHVVVVVARRSRWHPRGLDLSIHELSRSFTFSNLNERRRRV
jgi:hypothetical protein